MGDLNCDLLRPELPCTASLIKIMDLANVRVQTQHIAPTRITASSASCLDFIAVDHSLIIKDYTLSNLLISDHFPVIATIPSSASPVLNPIFRRSFKDINYSELGAKFDNIVVSQITSASQLEDELANWHSQVTALLDEYAPYRLFPMKTNLTSTNKLTRVLVNQRNTLANKLKRSNSSLDIGPCIAQVKTLNRRIKSRNRATLKSNANVAMSSHNTKEAWRFINKAMFR